jgi:hypothetical protein
MRQTRKGVNVGGFDDTTIGVLAHGPRRNRVPEKCRVRREGCLANKGQQGRENVKRRETKEYNRDMGDSVGRTRRPPRNKKGGDPNPPSGWRGVSPQKKTKRVEGDRVNGECTSANSFQIDAQLLQRDRIEVCNVDAARPKGRFGVGWDELRDEVGTDRELYKRGRISRLRRDVDRHY